MTEKEIELLGFKKKTEEGDLCRDFDGNEWVEDSFYYYTYEITRGLSFITPANTEIKDEKEWYVEFFNTEDTIKFYNFEEVQKLINLLVTAKNNTK